MIREGEGVYRQNFFSFLLYIGLDYQTGEKERFI